MKTKRKAQTKPAGGALRPAVAAAVLLFLGVLAGGAALAQPALAPSRGAHPEQLVLSQAQLERRMKAVGFLLEQSSAARQIEASGDAGARARRERAQESYRQAQLALQAGNPAEASQLLGAASALMLEGARLAAPAEVNGEKQRRDFDARLASVKTLLAADLRIGVEKHATPEAKAASHAVESLLTEATQLAAAGKLAEARPLLDRAYLVAKTAVSSMRRGETLERSVHFASKREEYEYEIERNNTHRALVQSLLADERSAQRAQGAVQESLQAAARLRGEAESKSAAGEYQGAIGQLERSTRELLRAIRGLGIFVPG